MKTETTKVQKNQNISVVVLKAALAVVTLVSTFSCSQTNFSPDENSSLYNPAYFENVYKTAASEVNYVQPNLEENKTTLSFQVEDSTGMNIQNLLASDIHVLENGKVIDNLTLSKNSVTLRKTVDILFAVDVTGSMTPTIESAKTRLIDFINNTRAQGYHTRMCLSTFGDYTVKKCVRFYNNDPNDASTITEVNELISEITKLKALKGTLDPGGKDLDENPMRAVIDAAQAPWGSDSQRFMILVTDAGFLYSPGNQGAVGTVAPYYVDVVKAIQQSNMKIFAVTPSLAGYDKPFSGAPGIVDQSEGEWYRYSDLVSGKITLNTVLNKILSSVDTTFFVNYTLTSSSALDPSKPLSQRNIEIELVNSNIGTIKGLAITSNLPNGRVPDPKAYVISDKKVNPATLKVYVNNVLQTSGYQLISGKSIEFTTARPANSKIKIVYQYESAKDSISLTPIRISVPPDKVSLLQIKINQVLLDPSLYEVVPISSSESTIIIQDSIFSFEDKYKINELGRMHIVIK